MTEPSMTPPASTSVNPAAAPNKLAGVNKPAVSGSPSAPNLTPAPQRSPAASATKSAQPHSTSEELEILIRARYSIIYVVTWEEERVERLLQQIAEKRNKKLFVWTITQGIV